MADTQDASEVELRHVPSGKFVAATLQRGMTQAHVDAIRAHWNPPLQNAAQAALRECQRDNIVERDAILDRLAQQDLQDAHWEWDRKHTAYGTDPNYTSFVLTKDGIPQGAMYALKGVTGRSGAAFGEKMLYVKYVAIAPWNRASLNGGRREFSGIGSVLMAAVVSESIDQGLRGRVALHSLPQAEYFYEKHIGMTSLGKDPHEENLRYFELTENAAAEFLGIAPKSGE